MNNADFKGKQIEVNNTQLNAQENANNYAAMLLSKEATELNI